MSEGSDRGLQIVTQIDKARRHSSHVCIIDNPSIRDALGGSVTKDEASEALNPIIIAVANEAVTARRWILDPILEILEHPRYTTLRDERHRGLHGNGRKRIGDLVTRRVPTTCRTSQV